MGIEEFIRRRDEIIDEVGWAVTLVMPAADDSEDGEPIGYTVGLTAHFTDLVLSDRVVRAGTS
ncbi:hypothetical protein [Micromonospora sp. RTP1Z1]|uniref:hypothetical protein n=1 Tax=Micromonospora sp. RTP1Z1 TaxID=2994043 RepID=UPI0029C9A7FD|nr:hypothetical protein [Micromonospora sp. RTP1Z1]